jgi:hypothetical protein
MGPGGHAMALGGLNYGHLIVVDLRRLAVRRTIQVAHGKKYEVPEVVPVSWPRADLVISYTERFLAHTEFPARLTLVDPHRRHQVRSLALHGSVEQARPLPGGGAVLLVNRTNQVSAARLVLIDPSGRVRSVTLDRIPAGFSGMQQRDPGLVVLGDLIEVVGTNRWVGQVDSGSMAVSYHRVPGLMEAHYPIPPPQDEGSAGALHDVSRAASRFANGRIAVMGGEGVPTRSGAKIRYISRPANILDIRTWRVVRVLPRIDFLRRANGYTIGSRVRYNRRYGEARAVGLTVFDHSGQRAYGIRLTRTDTWAARGEHLFVGDYRRAGVGVERRLSSGAVLREMPKGSRWSHNFVSLQRSGPSRRGRAMLAG